MGYSTGVQRLESNLDCSGSGKKKAGPGMSQLINATFCMKPLHYQAATKAGQVENALKLGELYYKLYVVGK